MSTNIINCEKFCTRSMMREYVLIDFHTRFTTELYSNPEIINELQWTLNLIEILFESLRINPKKAIVYSKECIDFYNDMTNIKFLLKKEVLDKIYHQDLYPKTIVSYLVDLKDEFSIEDNIFLLALDLCVITSINMYLHIYSCQQIATALYYFVNQYIENFEKYSFIKDKYPLSEEIYGRIIYAYQHTPSFISNKIQTNNDVIATVFDDGYKSYPLQKILEFICCEPNFDVIPNKSGIIINGLLGHGGYGRVDVQIIKGKEFAVKTFYKSENMFDELFKLNKLRHFNILRPIGIGNSCIAYEKLYFSLYQYINAIKDTENPKLEPILIKSYMFQLLSAVEHCHNNNLAHLDIKPENILLNEQGHLKLADFGLSKRFGVTSRTREEIPTTIHYAPPEVLLEEVEQGGQLKDLLEIDMWQIGCVFYFMLTNKSLVPRDCSFEQAYEEVMGLLCEIEKVDWNYLGLDDDLATDLSSKLLRDRVTAKEALKHEYFDEFRNKYIK